MPPKDPTPLYLRRDEFDELRSDVKVLLGLMGQHQTRLALAENDLNTLRRVVFGAVGIILTSVTVGVLALVVSHK